MRILHKGVAVLRLVPEIPDKAGVSVCEEDMFWGVVCVYVDQGFPFFFRSVLEVRMILDVFLFSFAFRSLFLSLLSVSSL